MDVFTSSNLLKVEAQRQELVKSTNLVAIDVYLSPHSVVVLFSGTFRPELFVDLSIAINSLEVFHELLLDDNSVFIVIHVSEDSGRSPDGVMVHVQPH